MKSNLDVWAIQANKDETRIALKRIKKDSSGNILYLNCWCKFNIGSKTIQNRIFDACFYSEESDTIILFAKDKISEKEIIAYLEEFGISYTVVAFEELRSAENYRDDETFPEVWFAREKYVLKDAIDESLTKGIHDCVYYPDIESSIELGYRATTDETFEVEGRFCKGAVVFEDKIVLLINQGDKRNVKREKAVEQLLIKKGIKYKIIRDAKRIIKRGG